MNYPKKIKMNCVSVPEENYSHHSGASKKQQRHMDKNSGHGTTRSSGGLRSCLRGEIDNEEVESKNDLEFWI